MIDMSKDKNQSDIYNEMDTEVEGTFKHGIKVHHKKGIRIRGATIHLKVNPSRYGYMNDYILSFELPNGKQVTFDSTHVSQTFTDVCEQIHLLAVGHKPFTASDKITVVVEGLPLRMSELDNQVEDTIPVDKAPDPMKVMSQPEAKEPVETSKTTETKPEMVIKADSKAKAEMDSRPNIEVNSNPKLILGPSLPMLQKSRDIVRNIRDMGLGYA